MHSTFCWLQILDKMAYLAGLALERHRVKGMKRNVKLYKLISEEVTDLIWLVDEHERIQYASPGLSLLEQIADSAAGNSVWNFIDPEDAESMKAAIFTAKTGKTAQLAAFRLCAGRRMMHVMEASVIPFQDGSRSRGSVLIAAKDVTSRKEEERKLKESVQRFQSLYHHHPAAIYSFDRTGRFISANTASERITGYSFDELEGRTFDFLVKQDDLAYTREMFHIAAQGVPKILQGAIQAVFGKEGGQGNRVLIRKLAATDMVECDIEAIRFAFEMLLDHLRHSFREMVLDIVLQEQSILVCMHSSECLIPSEDLNVFERSRPDQDTPATISLKVAKLFLEENRGSLGCLKDIFNKLDIEDRGQVCVLLNEYRDFSAK